ncbi:hypothetical protein CKO31_25860 [Thiohalocapsa halophila]|uniref:Uncharacterized protein n=1 Tax=Thiohalocapsa halophila TaxID=69359 RepID=A0ABS1CQV2_9GAMM|nr:hypothetical protein [Thiohalocapsa halophila]
MLLDQCSLGSQARRIPCRLLGQGIEPERGGLQTREHLVQATAELAQRAIIPAHAFRLGVEVFSKLVDRLLA